MNTLISEACDAKIRDITISSETKAKANTALLIVKKNINSLLENKLPIAIKAFNDSKLLSMQNNCAILEFFKQNCKSSNPSDVFPFIKLLSDNQLIAHNNYTSADQIKYQLLAVKNKINGVKNDPVLVNENIEGTLDNDISQVDFTTIANKTMHTDICAQHALLSIDIRNIFKEILDWVTVSADYMLITKINLVAARETLNCAQNAITENTAENIKTILESNVVFANTALFVATKEYTISKSYVKLSNDVLSMISDIYSQAHVLINKIGNNQDEIYKLQHFIKKYI